MAERDYDAIVVGAGPSGSACASLLSEKGARVLMLDKEKFPRDKPCGDAIGGKALNVIKRLGIEKEISESGFARSTGLVFSSPCGHEVEIPLAQSNKEMSGGYVCERKKFDAIVFARAKKSCNAVENARVEDVIIKDGKAIGVRARLADGSPVDYFAKVIVGADGVGSVVASRVGAKKIDPKHTCSALRGYYENVGGLKGNVEIHFLPECMPGYFWIFPLGGMRANVGVGMLVSDIMQKKTDLAKVLDACMKNPRFSSRFANAFLDGKIIGWSIPLASARRKCAGDGWVLLGDAASLVDPFSGEGVGNGMKSAAIAADVISPAIAKGEVSLSDCIDYEKKLWEDIGADISTSYAMQRLGRSGFLLDLVIGKAKKSKWVQDELAAMIASREAKRKATDPLFYLRVLLA